MIGAAFILLLGAEFLSEEKAQALPPLPPPMPPEEYGLLGQLIKDLVKGRKATFRPFGMGVNRQGKIYQWQDWLRKRIRKGNKALQAGNIDQVDRYATKISKALIKLEMLNAEPLEKDLVSAGAWFAYTEHGDVDRLLTELTGGEMPDQEATAPTQEPVNTKMETE